MLANHIWSFADDDERPDVSVTFIQPFLRYITKTKTTISVNSESTYDWKARNWSVSVNFVVSQLMKVGDHLLQVGIGARYWAVTPDSGPKGWGARLVVTFLFPE